MSLELFINSGSINEIDLSRIDGARFEDVFSINMNSCVSFYYNTQDFSIPPVTPPGTLNIPETNTFMFDENVAADWDNVTPTKIRLSLKSIGRLIERTNYQERMFEIIKNRKVGSQITITKYSTTSESDPTSFKTFEIVEANYFERVYDESGQRFYALEWGSINLTETADLSGLFDYLSSSEDRKDGFFTLTVTQVDTGVNSLEPPSHGDELSICITPSTKFGFLDVADAHFDSIQLDNIDVVSASIDSLFVTGSIEAETVYGDFRGEINSEKLENVLGIAPKTSIYSSFKFEENTWNSDQVFYGIPGIIPTDGYFIFNQDSSINGEYGESQWRNATPTKIRINTRTSEVSLESDINFKNKLFDIIKNSYVGSKITFFQQITNELGVQAYKEFQIDDIFYMEKRIIDGNPYYYQIMLGQKDLIETDDSLGYFTNYVPNLNIKGERVFTDTDRSGFFELTVKQIDPPNSFVYTEAPIQDQDFKVVLDVNVIRKEITVFTESKQYIVPNWAKKLTVYSIGAGGGGGAGSNGFGHHPGMGLVVDGYVDQSSGEIIKDNINTNDNGEQIFFVNEAFQEKIGHDVVIGGGGGAGGSVVIAEYLIKPAYVEAVDSLEAEIERLSIRLEVLNGIIPAPVFFDFDIDLTNLGFPPNKKRTAEELKILRDERDLIIKRLAELERELAETQGIPANTILDIYVGAPGKGGKGRRIIEDHPIEWDFYEKTTGFDPILGFEIFSLNSKVSNDNFWKTLAFQREYPRIWQKNAATAALLKIQPTWNTLLGDYLTTYTTNLLAGTIITYLSSELIDSMFNKPTSLRENDSLYTRDPNTGDAYFKPIDRNTLLSSTEADKYFEEWVNVAKKHAWFDADKLTMDDVRANPSFLISKMSQSQEFEMSLPSLMDAWNSVAKAKREAIANGAKWYADAYGPGLGAFGYAYEGSVVYYFDQFELTDVVGVMYGENGPGELYHFLFPDYTYVAMDGVNVVQKLGSRLKYRVLSTRYRYADKPFRITDVNDIQNRVTDKPKRQITINAKNPSQPNELSSFKYSVASTINSAIGMAGMFVPYISSFNTLLNIVDIILGNAAEDASTYVMIGKEFNRTGLKLSSQSDWIDKYIPTGFTTPDNLEFKFIYSLDRKNDFNFYNYNHYHSPDWAEFHGKNGGSSEIYLNGNCILRAPGGIGGTGGYAYRAILNPVHRANGQNNLAYRNFLVPGGAGPTQYPFAKLCFSSTVSNGGPGAYGMAAPSLLNSDVKEPTKHGAVAPDIIFNSDSYKINVAPSTPIFGNNVDHFSGPMIKNGFYGKTSALVGNSSYREDLENNLDRNSNNVYQIDGFVFEPTQPGIGRKFVGATHRANIDINKTFTSVNIPTPPGGGGGFGVTWQLLDRRESKIPIMSKNMLFGTEYTQYINQSQELCKYVFLGLGGKCLHTPNSFTSYLLRDTDDTGKLFEIPIYNGGNGGFGEYYTTNGERILAKVQTENVRDLDRSGDPLINYILPQNVSDRFGVGGGGGAAHYVTDWNVRPRPSTINTNFVPLFGTFNVGEEFHNPVQDGADGAPGIIVIIAESQI